MNSRNQNRVAGKQAAFTLIELLVVITIIGVLAGLVVGMSGLASRKMRDMRVNAELQNLVAGIESYKLQTGFYPPDNSRTDYAGSAAEQEWARTAQKYVVL
ncbi:MAG: prepilin-type N-terminal cleavage/methylation domain-containing protein [Verrucomicrobia bacterium]|nr:prepilin-type N-terminal cleavage/methylation domain-containing protein [Verrucomicrobiota bacterium]